MNHKGMGIMELVAALGIVALLAVVLLPAVGKTTTRMDDVKCLSNLRQIGMGILAYAHDHDGQLPGPLYRGQYPYWKHYSQISTYLVDYLNVEKSATKFRRKDVLVCPAYAKAVHTIGDAPVYSVNVHVPFGDSQDIRQPFGYPNNYNPGMFNTRVDWPPMRLLQLGGIANPSQVWAMRDLDQQDPHFETGSAGYFTPLPARPVHGSHRNALFFDFHVARMPVEPDSP